MKVRVENVGKWLWGEFGWWSGGGWCEVVVEILIIRQAKSLEDLAVQKLLSDVKVS